MNNTPKVSAISPDTQLDDFFPARFLTVKQFEKWGCQDLIVQIAELQSEEVYEPMSRATSMMPVIYLKTKNGEIHDQGYLLKTRVDKNSLKSSCSATKVGELIGSRIRISVSSFRGKPVLRIDPKAPQESNGG